MNNRDLDDPGVLLVYIISAVYTTTTTTLQR